MPLARGELAVLRHCQRPGAAVVACERLRAVDPEHELLTLVRELRDVGVGFRGVELHPGREREAFTGGEMDGAVGWHGNRLRAAELRPRTNQGSLVHLG